MSNQNYHPNNIYQGQRIPNNGFHYNPNMSVLHPVPPPSNMMGGLPMWAPSNWVGYYQPAMPPPIFVPNNNPLCFPATTNHLSTPAPFTPSLGFPSELPQFLSSNDILPFMGDPPTYEKVRYEVLPQANPPGGYLTRDDAASSLKRMSTLLGFNIGSYTSSGNSGKPGEDWVVWRCFDNGSRHKAKCKVRYRLNRNPFSGTYFIERMTGLCHHNHERVRRETRVKRSSPRR